jgi:death-on-curing protein
MSDPIEYLDLDDLIDLSRTLLGDPPPIRDLGLLGSAAARPQATAFGQDAYPDLVTKAAALLQSIVNNQALVDGNKRLGWLSAAVFLELNGVKASRASNDAVYELAIWIAASNPDLDDIIPRLRRVVQPGRRHT